MTITLRLTKFKSFIFGSMFNAEKYLMSIDELPELTQKNEEKKMLIVN